MFWAKRGSSIDLAEDTDTPWTREICYNTFMLFLCYCYCYVTNLLLTCYLQLFKQLSHQSVDKPPLII